MILIIIGILCLIWVIVRRRARKNPDRYLPEVYICREEFLNGERNYRE